jgi:hypothetical protein
MKIVKKDSRYIRFLQWWYYSDFTYIAEFYRGETTNLCTFFWLTIGVPFLWLGKKSFVGAALYFFLAALFIMPTIGVEEFNWGQLFLVVFGSVSITLAVVLTVVGVILWEEDHKPSTRTTPSSLRYVTAPIKATAAPFLIVFSVILSVIVFAFNIIKTLVLDLKRQACTIYRIE